jgi:hypothetical protein
VVEAPLKAIAKVAGAYELGRKEAWLDDLVDTAVVQPQVYAFGRVRTYSGKHGI